MSKSRYCEVDPQPNVRLLPYSDPLNGMFWAETGENPYDNKYDSPEWAHRCVKPWELTAGDVEQLEPKFGNLLYCSGPACKRGPNGCNAMGCHGIREAFCAAIGDVWIWVSDIAAEREGSVDGGRAQ